MILCRWLSCQWRSQASMARLNTVRLGLDRVSDITRSIVNTEFYYTLSISVRCVSVWTLCQVTLRQSVGDVWKFAAIVAILQRAHVHVAPFLQLLQPAALFLALTVGIKHYTHPQSTWTQRSRHTSRCERSKNCGVMEEVVDFNVTACKNADFTFLVQSTNKMTFKCQF